MELGESLDDVSATFWTECTFLIAGHLNLAYTILGSHSSLDLSVLYLKFPSNISLVLLNKRCETIGIGLGQIEDN
jgi:hypothetical protein